MTSSFVVRSTVLFAAALTLSSAASAAPITYKQSGVASGQIGALTFTNAFVEWTMLGDTDNVETKSFDLETGDPYTAYVNVSSLTTLVISGIGTATLTDPNAIYAFPTPISLGDGFPVLPVVVMGTLDDPPSTDSFTGIGAAATSLLLGYDLKSSFKPVVAVGGVGHPTTESVNTSLGVLTFTANISENAKGTFSATVTPVPEPATFLLLGSGLVGLVARNRSRSRARARD
jgi:hypothetical protein